MNSPLHIPNIGKINVGEKPFGRNCTKFKIKEIGKVVKLLGSTHQSHQNHLQSSLQQ